MGFYEGRILLAPPFLYAENKNTRYLRQIIPWEGHTTINFIWRLTEIEWPRRRPYFQSKFMIDFSSTSTQKRQLFDIFCGIHYGLHGLVLIQLTYRQYMVKEQSDGTIGRLHYMIAIWLEWLYILVLYFEKILENLFQFM